MERFCLTLDQSLRICDSCPNFRKVIGFDPAKSKPFHFVELIDSSESNRLEEINTLFKIDGGEFHFSVAMAEKTFGKKRFLWTGYFSKTLKMFFLVLDSEDKYWTKLRTSNVLELLSDAVIEVDENKKITFVSPSTSQLLGYNEKDILGQSVFCLFDEAGRKTMEKRLKERFSGADSHHESILKHKDGHDVPMTVSARPLHDPAGKISRALAVLSDRSKINELEEESIWAQLAIDQACFVSTTDSAGNINYINEKFCEVLGYKRNELIGKNHRVISSGYHDKNHFKKMWDTISSGEIWRSEMCNKTKDGRYVWFDTTIVPHQGHDGKVDRYQAIRFNITAQKETLLLLDSIVENLPTALFAKDCQNQYRFTVWNRRSEELFGLKKKDVYEKNDYDFFPKDQADSFREKDVNTMSGTIRQTIEEEPVDGKKGRVWVRTHKVPVFDWHGRPKLLLGISEDITEKRAKDQLINEQAAKIAHTAKLSSLGEMASGIAHEINNPLAIIHGKAAQIQMLVEKKDVDVEQVKLAIEVVKKTVDRIAKIVRGLRTFSRSAERDPFVQTSLNSVIEDTLSFCRERFRARKIDLRVKSSSDIEFECRPAQVSQVLLNLLNNAFDAVVELETPWVSVETRDLADQIEVSVIDCGAGIPKRVAAKLMEPFFTTKEVGKGTGLGLSISKGITDDHHGSLTLDEKSPNTRFVLRLPKKQPALAKKKAA